MKASGSKRKRDLGSKSDLYLPNHIVDRIFTFLPIKDVVSSSLVAKPFLDSRLYVRNFCFDKYFHIDCFLMDRSQTSIINNIITNHLGKKIDSFQLYVDTPKEYIPLLKNWIQVAASKGLEVLEIDFPKPNNDASFYIMDSHIFDIETLRSVRLIYCKLRFLSPQLRFLKSLSLTKVPVLPTFIRDLFKTCVVLESLELDDCSSIGPLTIKGSNKLKTLVIRCCFDIMLITVYNPTITTFQYHGEIDKIRFVEPILFRLKDVLFNFGITTSSWRQDMSERHDLIQVLRNVETLSINHVLLEGLTPRYVDFEYVNIDCYLSNLKELQLVRHGLTFVNPWDIVSFVKNCPLIERLFLDFGECPMEAGIYWNLVGKEKFENCQVEFPELKILKVKAFKKLELEEKLVSFFSSRARSLESLIIVAKKNQTEIKPSDFITVSNVAVVSIYRHYYKDLSLVRPKQGIL